MTKLRDFVKIQFNLKYGNLKTMKVLHLICFDDEGYSTRRRKDLLEFEGFGFDEDSEFYNGKLDEIKKIDLPDLFAVCHVLDLSYNGKSEDVAERILKFLNSCEADKELNADDEQVEDDDDLNDDEEAKKTQKCKEVKTNKKLNTRRSTEDERRDKRKEVERRNKKPIDDDEENSEDEVQDEDNSEEDNRRGKLNRRHRSDPFALTFKDVEDSIKCYDGRSEYPIRKWIDDFEEIADITCWSDLQKLIYAKKCLRGLAKMFVQAEKGIKTWAILKRKLIEEFEEKVSSAQLHKLLMNRKKKREESVREYVLIMREIGSRGYIEEEVIIQYIIDGIQDENNNKIILYGAKNFAEFKDKVKLYEEIKSKENLEQHRNKTHKNTFKKNDEREFKNVQNEGQKICFNCGVKGHKANTCPDKNKGTKCFKCNKFGHISTKCPGNNRDNERAGSSNHRINVVEVAEHNALNLRIDNITIKAMLDTGSDINAIREDILREHFENIDVDETPITVRGLGGRKLFTLGSFSKNVTLNNEEFHLKFHILPRMATSHKAIIGKELLSKADVTFRDGQIIIFNKEATNFLMEITANEDNEENIELRHIENKENRLKVNELIHKYEPEKTKTADIKMKIIMKTEEPIYQRPRRLAMPEKIEVDNQIREWLKEGIIRESSSDFASPIVLVKKKDGRTRICCDYRKLNKNIVKDRFPLPLIEDILDRLQAAVYFSTIDLKNGFFHVPVDEDSIKYTSFIVPTGQYEFLKCPFGLCNSPAVFQRYITKIFRQLMLENKIMYYMDDIIIMSSTEDEGVERLEEVLKICKKYGLEIKKKKCQFLKRRVEFLGYIIENGQVQPSEEKTLAIRKFPEPRTMKQIQSFLGLTGYFRKFVQNYAMIAKPLSDLLRNENSFKFEDQQKQSFETLKSLLCAEPILKIFKPGVDTELHTDASKFGYGACLLQRADDDSKLHPVFYMSKKTTPAEEKYNSYELEVLAVIQALKKFRIYLLGTKFKIITDCSAFQKTMDKKELTTRVARWALLLEEFTYEIQHRKGSSMRHVDALSRNPTVMVIAQIMTEENGLIERLRNAQNNDEHLKALKKILEIENYEDYFLRNEIVYKYKDGKELIVVPKVMQREIIRRAHEVGHFAVTKTEEIIEREFYIPSVKEKIKKCMRNCIPCILGAKKEGKKEGLLHVIDKGDAPLNTYHIDHLGPLPSTNKNYQHILAVIDDFTKFTWLYATKTVTSKETIACLKKQQSIFGNPARIISDRGTAFTSQEFQEYCQEEGIHHILVTTGVPRGNGQIERINRTIILVLTKLSIDNPMKWYQFIDQVQRVLNSTYQRSLNTTPFEVLTGIKMRNKEDIRIQELIDQRLAEEFNEKREELRLESKKQILKVQEENKKQYNLRRRKPRKYQKGDLVAVKRTQFGPGLKLNRKFLGPYKIIKVKPNERFDVIKIGQHEGPIKTSTCTEYLKPWVENQSDSESESDSMSDGRM